MINFENTTDFLVANLDCRAQDPDAQVYISPEYTQPYMLTIRSTIACSTKLLGWIFEAASSNRL